jgi:hypothetical protein
MTPLKSQSFFNILAIVFGLASAIAGSLFFIAP